MTAPDLTAAELDALEALAEVEAALGRMRLCDCGCGDLVQEHGPAIIAMARRATSSGEWLNRMAEAVGYTGAAHPADVLQRIDDAVAAEARVRELEAERDEYKAQNSVPGILDEVENPAPIPVGAPGSNARRAWCLGRALQTAERELGETLDRAIGAEAERDAARKTIRDAVQWLEAYEPHLPSVLHNLRAALAKGPV